ncbi:glyoxalase [Actinomycetospora sp. NBRC 106375]|uniref:VOC family protein n=1 Tax=Actinomycetospora sp. NBRC 106375 TaxID=3032207 RepID=UPI0024A2C0E2|nr:VOC family protein [Actinomycetospora sp. NBRC 106375]GLZ50092.1 glyoxalase [Actinomycetospora sp. NBRC 106375]
MSTIAPQRYTATVIPHVMVDGAREAMAFYRQAFGAEELFTIDAPDGSVVHAEMSIGSSVFMLGDADAPFAPPGPPGSTVGLHVYVPDVDDLASRAADAGAEVLQEPTDMFYGDRSVMLRDPFGHLWVFLTHHDDLSIDDIVARGRALLRTSDS